jgi:hypothetical protein
MAQYDVHELKIPLGVYRLVVDIQSEQLRDLRSRVVVPLIVSTAEKIDRLTPVIVVDGASYVFVAHEIISVHRNQLGAVLANVKDQHYGIVGALDFLFHGF